MLTTSEKTILDSIVVASDNNPNKPEYPPMAPRFPATPTHKLKVPGYSNVWLKDESKNPTGTHKDRMAWEIIVTYREYLLAKQNGYYQGALPHMSVISSGSAAVAIQTALRTYGLPNLKVLIDSQTQEDILRYLTKIGCEVYPVDLHKKALSWKEILKLTNNLNGIDITSDESLGPTTRFYDWLSYEVINFSPEFCFIPFGTGHLYENIMNINKQEVASQKHDPRFSGDVQKLKHCNFLGATATRADTKATMLYSHHLPFSHYNKQWLASYKRAGFCGDRSGVCGVEERFLEDAMKIAKSQDMICDYSGIAGLGLLLQISGTIRHDSKILIVNTGKCHFK